MGGLQPTAYHQAQEHGGAGLNLSELSDTLPQHFSQHDEAERSTSGSSTTLHRQSPSPFAGQTPMTTPGYNIYAAQYGAPYQQMTGNPQAYLHHQGNQTPQNLGQAPYSSHNYYPHQQQQPFVVYPSPYGQPGQHHPGLPTPYAQSFGRGTNQGFGVGAMAQPIPDVSSIPGRVSQYGGFSPSGHLGYGPGPGAMFARSGPIQGNLGNSTSKLTTGSIPSSPRGPPRKPKQSGHALWVGNLPSGTQIVNLKDHFSHEATKTIESVFLISKSNCAFVNYRSDEACAAAMSRFHDSRFQGVRLVCRLRRGGPGPASGIPTGPATLIPAIAASQSAIESIRQNREVSSRAEAIAQEDDSTQGQTPAKGSNKYFIMKSLTIEDMELSIRNSIWATQAHNEEALNKAFETAENVYLVFSANKSGEYFGYARMTSSITEEVAATLEWAPKPGTVTDDPELPRAIPTPATEWAPKGRIIDDSARGTIFWEADPEDGDLATLVDGEVEKPELADPTGVAEDPKEPSTQFGAQAFGKPFRIEWLATNRLPFYRTRGLRNPWNANREVKIARDGTELEPSVGKRLLQMFHGIPPESGQQTGWPQ
ncbi:MAG: hypothetical protein LQ337_000996 [Flavoplaca oasis]|nr:MAG: hypothetical protein LQ337_000996 [Flavoplaca oasis]